MTKLDTITISDDPANVRDMMERGSFHSHQDGRWRYSPYGGATTYCNDPTAQFPVRAEFSDNQAGAACPALGIYAHIHSDGTRGLRTYSETSERVLAQIYGPRNAGEREFREWLFATMAETVAA